MHLFLIKKNLDKISFTKYRPKAYTRSFPGSRTLLRILTVVCNTVNAHC